MHLTFDLKTLMRMYDVGQYTAELTMSRLVKRNSHTAEPGIAMEQCS